MPPKPQDTWPDGRKKPVRKAANRQGEAMIKATLAAFPNAANMMQLPLGQDFLADMKRECLPDEDIDDGYDDDAPITKGMARPECRCEDYQRTSCVNEHIPFASCRSFPPYKHMPWAELPGDPGPEHGVNILGQIVAGGGAKCHRHEIWLTSSRGDHGIKVLFYPEEDQLKAKGLLSAYKEQINRLQPGHTVFLVEPKTKFFMDMTKGIRYESPALWVFKVGIEDLMEEGRKALHNMDALQHEVPKEMICTQCTNIFSNPAQRIKCKCKVACYCGAACESAALGGAHGKLCADMGMVLWCAVVHRRRVVVDPTFPRSRRPPFIANPPTVAAAYHQATDACPRYCYNPQHADTFNSTPPSKELTERIKKSIDYAIEMAAGINSPYCFQTGDLGARRR